MSRLYGDDWILEHLNGHFELQDEILQILALCIGDASLRHYLETQASFTSQDSLASQKLP